MATFNASLLAFINLIAPDVKRHERLIGDLDGLNTAQKQTIVLALNSLKTAIDTRPALSTVIDDTAASSVSDKVWSPAKTSAAIDAAIAALMGTSSQVTQALTALSNAFNADKSAEVVLLGLVARKVDFNQAQTLTAAQQKRARDNINVLGLPEVTARLGVNPNFAAAYTQAMTPTPVYVPPPPPPVAPWYEGAALNAGHPTWQAADTWAQSLAYANFGAYYQYLQQQLAG
jgi:hypothetical protein